MFCYTCVMDYNLQLFNNNIIIISKKIIKYALFIHTGHLYSPIYLEVAPMQSQTQYPLQSVCKEMPLPRQDIRKSESLHSRCNLNAAAAAAAHVKSSLPHSITLPKISSQGLLLV